MAKIAIPALIVIIVVPVLIAALVHAMFAVIVGRGSTSSDNCVVAGTPAGDGAYQPEQMVNAATIVAVGKQLRVPEQGWVVAIAAAMQESGLRNLHGGDRDSLGLFQQRPSQGWGTPEQITNPTYAATQFYRTLLDVPEWQQMSVNDAAQAVEQSGVPGAYAQHEADARSLVSGGVGSATCTTIPENQATGERVARASGPRL